MCLSLESSSSYTPAPRKIIMDWKVIEGALSRWFQTVFIFQPYLWKIPILTIYIHNMFQLGRFHHQPDIYWPRTYKKFLLLGQRCHPCHSSLHRFVILGRLEPPNSLQFGRVYSKKSCGEHCEAPCRSCFF